MSSSPPDQPSTSGTDEDDRPSHSNDYVLDSIPTTSSEPPTSSLLTMLHVIVPEDRIYPDPAMFEEYVNRQRRIQSARSALDVLKLEEMKKEEEEEEGSDEQELEDANSGKYWCGENNVKEELVETDSKQELEESFCEEELEEPDVEKEKTPSIEVPPVEESTEQKIDRLTDTFMRDIDDEAHPIPDSSDAEDIPSGSGNSDEEEEEEEEAGGSSSSYEEGDDGVEGHSSDISSEEQDADNNEEETTITTVFQEDVMLTTAGRMAEFPNEEDDVEHEDETGIEADNESEDSSEDEARSEFDFSLVCLPSSSSIQPLEQFDPSDNGEWKTSYDVTYQMIREGKDEFDDFLIESLGMEVDEESAGPSHDIFKEVLSKDDFSTRQDEDRDEGMVGPSGTTREDRNEDAGSSKSIHRDVENDLDDRACSSSNESSDSYDESCELEIRPNEHDVEPETVEMEIDREAEGPFDENHAGLKRAKDDDKPVEEVSSISTHDDDPLEALQAAGPSGESSNGDSNDFEISTSVTSEDDAVTGKLPDSIAGTSIQEYLSNSDDVTDVPEPDDLTSSFDTDQSEEAAVEELSTQLSENHNKVPDPKDPIGRTDSDESDTTIRDVSEDEIDSDNSNITVNGLSELSFSENVADDSNNVPDKEVRTVPLEEVASGSSPDESEVEAASEVEEQLLYEDAEVADPDESSSHSSEDDVSYDFAPSVSSEDHSVKNVDVSTSGVQDSAAHVNEVGLEELFLNEMDEDLASRSCSSEEEPDVDMEDENLSSGSSDSFEDRPPDDMEDRSFSSGSSESLEERYFDDIKDDEYSSDYHEQLDEQYIDEVEDDEYSAGSRASMDDDEMEDEHLSSVSGDSPPGSYRDEIDDEESSDGFGESQDGPNVEDEDQSFFSDESLDGSYRDDMEDGEATSGDSLDEPDVDQLEGEANSSASGESLAESYRDEMEDQNLSPGSGESLDGRYTDDSEDDEYSSDFHESVDAADANYSLVAPGSPVSEESVDQCEVDQLDDFLEIHIVMDQIVETVVNDFEAGTSYNQDADGLFDAEDDQFDLEDKGSEAEQDQLDSEVEPSHHEAEESQFDIEDEDFEADQDHLDSGDDNSEAGPSHRVVEEDQHNHEDVEENHFDSEDEVVEPSQYVAEGTMETGDDLPEAVSEDDSSLSESDSHVSEKNCILFEDSPIMSETEIDLLEVELDHFNQQEDEEESLQESESENSLQESDSEGALHDSGSEHSVQETEENESDTEQHDDDYREEEHGANVHDDLSPSTQEIEEEDDTNVDEPESYCEDSDEFIDDEEDREGYESVDNDSYVCSDDEEEPGGMPTAAGSNTDLSEFARNDEEKEHNSEYSESNCDDSYKCSDDEDDLEHGLEDEPTVNVEDDLAPGDVAMSEEIEAEDLEPNTGVSELTHDDDKDGISEGSDYHCHESRGGSDKEDDPEEVKSTPSDFRVGRGEVTVSDLPNHVANDQFDWSLYGDFPIADKLFDWTPFLETNHDTSHSIYFDCAAIESQDDDFYTADEDESISSEPESYSDSEQEALSSTSRPASSTDGEEERDDRRIRTMPMYSSGSGDSEDSESEHVDHEEDVDSDHSVEKSPLGNLDEIIESFKIADLPMDVEERVLALAEKTCFVLPSSDESTDSESSEVGGDYYLDENVTNSSDDTSEFLDDNVKGESPFEDSLREVEDHLEHVLDIFGKSQYELQSEIPVCSVTLTQGEDELSHSKLIAAEVLKSGEVLVEGFDSETDNVSGEVVKVETDEMTVEDIKDEFVENEEDDEFESESETEFDIENDLTEEDLEGIGVVPSFLPEIQESLVWTKKEVVEAAVFLHTIGRKKVVIDYSDDDEVTEDGTRDDEDNESDDASDEDEKEEEEPVRIPPTESDAALSDPQTEADGPVLEPKVESDDALLKPEVEMTDALLDAEVKLESPDPPNPEMESETSESSSDDELEEPTSFPVLRETYVHQRYGSESPVSGHYSSSEESDPDATMMADVKKEPIDDVTVPFVKEEIMDEIKQEVEDDFGQQEMNPLALTTLLDEIKCEDVKMEVEEKYDVDGEQEEQQPESSVSSDATSSISLSFVSSTVSSTDQSIASSSTLPETTVSQFLESADLAEAAPPEESSSDSSDWESDDGLHVKTEGLFKEILTGDFGIPFDQLFHFNEGVIEKAYELLKDFSWRQEVKSDFKRFKQLKDAEFRKRAANSTRQEPDVSNLIVIGASDSTLSEPSDKASTSAEKKKRRRVEEVVPKTEEDENEPTLTNGTEPPIAVNDMKEESSDESENEVEPTPEELWAEFIKERRAKIEEQFTHDEFDFLQEVVTGLMRKIHGPLKRAELMSHASAVLISHMYDKVENIAPSCPGFRALTPEEELPVHPGIEDEQGQPDAAANAEGTESSGEDVLSGNDAPPTTTSRRGRRRRLLATTHASSPMVRRDLHEMSVSSPRPKLDSPQPSTSTPLRAARFSERFETRTPERRESSVPLSLPSDPAPDMASEKISTPTLIASPPSETVETPKTELKDTKKKEVKDEKAEEDTGPSSKTRQRRNAAAIATAVQSVNNPTPTTKTKKETNGRKKNAGRGSAKKKEEEEPTYCTCERVSFGEMIGCDNDKCEIEWFHFECVQLTSKPKGRWYCPNCRNPDNAKLPKTASTPATRSSKASTEKD